jgi:hypothetical protein
MSFTIYFEGETNDTDSAAFLIAIAEPGVWDVIHPVRGKLKMQPVSVKAHDGIDSGNISAIDLTWIIPDALDLQHSSPDLSGLIDGTFVDVQGTSTTGLSRIGVALANLASAYGAIQAGLDALEGRIANATGTFLSLYSQVSTALSSLSTDVLSIAGMTIQLVAAPGLMIGDIATRVGNFIATGEAILGLAPQTSPGALTDATAAQARGVEFYCACVSCAMVQEILAQAPTTRGQAIATIGQLLQWWSDMLSACEGTQALYSGSTLASTYTAFVDSYPALMELLRLAISYLLSIIYDLKTEIRFTLKAERAPLAVAIDYYAAKGWDDSLFDLFIASNGLYGDQINLLPAGFQVVIYA